VKLSSKGPKSDVTAPIRMNTPVVLAKAKGGNVTSVEGVAGKGEGSATTGDVHPRLATFTRGC
jgi:hypothetical protein